MLELNLEEADQFNRDPGGAGDADTGVFVSWVHLFDVALGDDVARGRPPVTRHDNAARERDRHDRGAVRRFDLLARGRAPSRQQVRRVGAQEVRE
jgi:hypothetical protein